MRPTAPTFPRSTRRSSILSRPSGRRSEPLLKNATVVLGLVPTHTFADCPKLDLICIPGGNSGVVQALGDRETIEFVQQQSRTAKYVTSVCTGAFILGAAGLLNGRRATLTYARVRMTDSAPGMHVPPHRIVGPTRI